MGLNWSSPPNGKGRLMVKLSPSLPPLDVCALAVTAAHERAIKTKIAPKIRE